MRLSGSYHNNRVLSFLYIYSCNIHTHNIIILGVQTVLVHSKEFMGYKFRPDRFNNNGYYNCYKQLK